MKQDEDETTGSVQLSQKGVHDGRRRIELSHSHGHGVAVVAAVNGVI